MIRQKNEKSHIKIFGSDGDSAFKKYGAGKNSHPREWEQTIDKLKQAGCRFKWRENAWAYDPENGKAGFIILPPNASFSALLHEAKHFWDDFELGFPCFGFCMRQPDLRWRMEFWAYVEELKFARENKDLELAKEILENMRRRKRRF
jgi:hypothetical protein